MTQQEKDFLDFIGDRAEITINSTLFQMTKEYFCNNVLPEDLYSKEQLEEALKRILTDCKNYGQIR